MNFHPMLVGAAILFTACSSPKYTYHFDHYDYLSGKKATTAEPVRVIEEDSPLQINSTTLVASAENKTVAIEDKKEKTAATNAEILTKKYTSMSKANRKVFRSQIKKEIKNFVKLKEVGKKDNGASVEATKAFDTTVALALAFGIAGILLTVLAGTSNVLWVLGAICIVIGGGLFVKWVSDGNG